MLIWKWILAVLILIGVALGTVVSAVNVATIRVIPSHGVIKTVSTVNASVSIPSYGIINYGRSSFEEEHAIEKIIKDETKKLVSAMSRRVIPNIVISIVLKMMDDDVALLTLHNLKTALWTFPCPPSLVPPRGARG